MYELFAIMIHSGSAFDEHYYEYIKHFNFGKWFSFNDQIVSSYGNQLLTVPVIYIFHNTKNVNGGIFGIFVHHSDKNYFPETLKSVMEYVFFL